MHWFGPSHKKILTIVLRAPVICLRIAFSLSIDESKQLKSFVMSREVACNSLYSVTCSPRWGIKMQKESDSTECLR